MNKILAAVWFILIVGGLLCLVQMCTCHAQTVALNTAIIPIETYERALIIKGKVAGDWRSWLVIECHNGDEWRANGYDPSYTRIVMDYKPLFRKLPNGQWEIMMTSEIAKNLP